MFDYLIVGAGLTGAIFAHEMRKAGRTCLVIDKKPHIAGTCYTENISGITVHKYGAHIFKTNNEETYKYISKFCTMNPFINSPVAENGGKIYSLPFGLRMVNEVYGIGDPKLAEDRLKLERTNYENPVTVEQLATNNVGWHLYDMFIKNYTEKQWGTKCSELPATIMSDIPFRDTYDVNYYDCRYQGIPEEGYTYVVEKLLQGSTVMLNTRYDKTMNERAHKVIYTGRIDEYFDYQFGELGYRGLRWEEKFIKTDNYQGNAVVNHCGAKPEYTRSIEHKHFSRNKVKGRTIVSLEYPCQAKESEPFYPIPTEDNLKTYSKYRVLAESEKNVIFAGRMGTYEYDDMATAIEKSLALAKEEIK